MSQSALITVITNAILKAAKPLRRDFGEVDKLQVSRKGTANFVTNADIRTEKILIEELQHARKQFGFLTEESGVVGDPNADFRFVIDPIDGTTNFIHAIPYFCVSVGVEKRLANGDYEVIAGVIYDPIQDEMFVTEKGMGATVNNRKLKVSGRTDELLLATVAPRTSRPNYPEVEAAFHRITSAGATVRCAGAAALDLAYVAAGRYEGIWYHHLQPWDIAAGLLLVQEAGGIITEIDGGSAMMQSGSVLASNGHIHRSLQEKLNPSSLAKAATS
jgi:myo-inositol-1(or 4)-monophosphatase